MSIFVGYTLLQARLRQSMQTYNDDGNPYAMALIPSERVRLEFYERTYPQHVFDLNQNDIKKLISPVDGHLHTIIRNCGLVWNPSLTPPRWLTPQELATAMGFPVDDGSIKITGVSCWISRSMGAKNFRSHRSAMNQIGNSMHVNAIGSVIMATLYAYPGVVGAARPAGLTRHDSDTRTPARLTRHDSDTGSAGPDDASFSVKRPLSQSSFAKAVEGLRLAKKLKDNSSEGKR